MLASYAVRTGVTLNIYVNMRTYKHYSFIIYYDYHEISKAYKKYSYLKKVSITCSKNDKTVLKQPDA